MLCIHAETRARPNPGISFNNFSRAALSSSRDPRRRWRRSGPAPRENDDDGYVGCARAPALLYTARVPVIMWRKRSLYPYDPDRRCRSFSAAAARACGCTIDLLRPLVAAAAAAAAAAAGPNEHARRAAKLRVLAERRVPARCSLHDDFSISFDRLAGDRLATAVLPPLAPLPRTHTPTHNRPLTPQPSSGCLRAFHGNPSSARRACSLVLLLLLLLLFVPYYRALSSGWRNRTL